MAIWSLAKMFVRHYISVLSFKSGNINRNLTVNNPMIAKPIHVETWIAIITPKNIIAKCKAK
jgi:hypothetical protein